MCHRFPPVLKLQLHLENEQNVVFEDDKAMEALEKNARTMLTAYFELNANSAFVFDTYYVLTIS